MKANRKTVVPLTPETGFRAVPWRLTDIAVVLIPLMAIRLVPVILGKEQYSSLSFWIWLGLLISGMVWMAFAPLWLARRRGAVLKVHFRNTRVVREVLIAIGLYVAFIVSLFAITCLWIVVARSLPSTDDPLSGAYHSNPIALWIALIGGVTVSPVVEEIAFRGFLYSALRQRMPIIPATILQAVAFGFLHSYGTFGTVLVILMGIALALAYEWRKTLLVPITMHLIQNAIVLIHFLVWAAMAGNAVLGIHGVDTEQGCRIPHVASESGAEEAGLQVGDIVDHVEDIPVYSAREIAEVIHTRKPGETVWVGFIRNEKFYELLVRLKPKP